MQCYTTVLHRPPIRQFFDMMSPANSTLSRSVYRSLLRELPVRPPRQTILSSRSALHKSMRTAVETGPNANGDANRNIHNLKMLAEYLRAQRRYNILVDRYNPGMNLSDEERIRLTARRVGMDLPVEASA